MVRIQSYRKSSCSSIAALALAAVLAVASTLGGLVLNNWIKGWLDPATGGAEGHKAATGLFHFSLVGVATLVVVAIGVAISFWLFGPRRAIPVEQPAARSPLTVVGRRDLFGDTLNEAIFMRPGQQLTSGLHRVEASGIDGTVNGTAAVLGGLSARLRRAQNGFVRTYALTMVAGAAMVGAVLVLGRLG